MTLQRLALEKELILRRKKAQTDLFWLARDICGFDKLTESFHKPMLDASDRLRIARRLGKGKDQCWIWPREHYKTTCLKAMIVQDFLFDPTTTITWWHAVEEMAQEVCEAVSTMLQKNKELRRLFPPGVLPSEHAKRFIGKQQFRLMSNDPNHAPSFRAWGATSEATGGHSAIGYLDDIIARQTVEDSQMPSRRRWYQNTVRNVILGNGWLNASGTRWDQDDIFSDWLKSSYWTVTVRACLETAAIADYKGKPVLFPMEIIKKKRAEMGESEFAAQMMNDPSPSFEKPWDSRVCERFVKIDYAHGPGVTVVLSDPAPAQIGSALGIEEKQRADGSKNFWAIAVVRFKSHGERREIILLDGSASQGWDTDDGFSEMCRLLIKWRARYYAIEKTGQAVAFYTADMLRIARQMGVSARAIDLTMTYKGKNIQFKALADRAKMDELLIAETVPKDFLDPFLQQARDWRPLPGGRNTNKFDDHANVVSFATDPVFLKYAPVSFYGYEESPWEKTAIPNELGTRHVRYN